MTTQSTFDIAYFKKKEHYLEVINQFAITLLDAKTVDEILWAVAKNAIAQLGYIDCVIYLYDEDREVLIQKAAHGPKNPIDLDILNPIAIKIGEGIVGNVAKTKKGEIITDTGKDPRYILDGLTGLSEIAVPIIHNNKIIGVIDSEHSEKDFFPADDLKILTTIASMTAAKLSQAFYDQKLHDYQNDLKELVHVKTLELNKTLNELTAQKLEITDSINYAKRIQNAVLKTRISVEEILPKSFFFYKPKDIISGDFYVAEKVEDKIILVVADCTGHGVPGGIISMVCHSAIKRSIRRVGLSDAAKILDETRNLIIETFGGSDEEIKDGMDIALCLLDINTNELQYAGANINLNYVKNNKLYVIKPNKQPVGSHIQMEPFTNHVIQLSKDDTIYIFTDGFSDQFGGKQGKKFKQKQLSELILSNYALDLKKQCELIEETFDTWRGNIPQVDDICVVGVRL
jgi:serine phosphatase RsbU (regulator of sigma subunit)